ncbi:MAG TPA: hypothetical protein VH796_16105 [Nitrososphaeraceae archaeon]
MLVKMKMVDDDNDAGNKVDGYVSDNDILYLHAKKVQLKPRDEKGTYYCSD